MFSNTIRISSVSDYITPSQECIKPLMDKVKLQDINDFQHQQMQTKPDLIKLNAKQTAKVSLQDCLACSGCITTAETMLIESHSVDEFLNRAKKASRTVIAISAQSRASIAHHYKLSDVDAQRGIIAFFAKMASNITVVDMHSLVELALLKSQEEFLQATKRPLICSECPGWVCYAEKTLDPTIIEHMSKVKSPQQLFGTMVKSKFPDAYVVTVMPCYDKKLESVRMQNKEEVDTVLTTGELVDLMKEVTDMASISTGLESLLEVSEENSLSYFNHAGNDTSNRYIDSIIEGFIHKEGFTKAEIFEHPRKNTDFMEITVKNDGVIVGQFARVYGLKNIANLVNQIKSGTCKYLYVEVMACPSGCLNGGGQVKVKTTKEYKQQDYINEMRMIMTQAENKVLRSITETKLLQFGVNCLTSFQHVPKTIGNLEW